MKLASGVRVSKRIAAILVMLVIAGCAKQVGQITLASAEISASQQNLVNTDTQTPLDNCGDPCMIEHNNGGVIADFENAGDAIHDGARQMLVIDGYCASACMVMADRARPRACITSRAQFGYHETNYVRPIPLSADLNGWVMNHGGYPSYAAMGIMPNQAAQQFWPVCSQDLTATLAAGQSLPTQQTAPEKVDGVVNIRG
jgi:hypothetical protein